MGVLRCGSVEDELSVKQGGDGSSPRLDANADFVGGRT